MNKILLEQGPEESFSKWALHMSYGLSKNPDRRSAALDWQEQKQEGNSVLKKNFISGIRHRLPYQ